ncbi:hypothetical protein FKM82_019586 [Ascaphus truei]
MALDRSSWNPCLICEKSPTRYSFVIPGEFLCLGREVSLAAMLHSPAALRGFLLRHEEARNALLGGFLQLTAHPLRSPCPHQDLGGTLLLLSRC